MSFVFKICSRCKGRSRLHDRIDVFAVRGGSVSIYGHAGRTFSQAINNDYEFLRKVTSGDDHSLHLGLVDRHLLKKTFSV